MQGPVHKLKERKIEERECENILNKGAKKGKMERLKQKRKYTGIKQKGHNAMNEKEWIQ